MQELCFRRLIDLLADKLAGEHGDKGKPLTPEQIVLSGLEMLGGSHFQRNPAVLTGCVQTSIFRIFYK